MKMDGKLASGPFRAVSRVPHKPQEFSRLHFLAFFKVGVGVQMCVVIIDTTIRGDSYTVSALSSQPRLVITPSVMLRTG